jgi:hypothetical protein
MLRTKKSRLLLAMSLAAALGAGAAGSLLGDCGPFTDVPPAFCAAVFEISVLGITAGTSATTYAPDQVVTRLQMAPFLKRTVDTTLLRGSRRAALDQFWTMRGSAPVGTTSLGFPPISCRSDGTDVWVPSSSGKVFRVRGSDGKLLDTWTNATGATGALVTPFGVLVSGATEPGNLYRIDPAAPAGDVASVAADLGDDPGMMAFDGTRIWTVNHGTPAKAPGNISIITPGPSTPWTSTTVSTGFAFPIGILFDGSNIWVTDPGANKLVKLDANGAILQSVSIGNAGYPAFDGTNIWVPSSGPAAVVVVRASTGAVVGSITDNELANPVAAAFDGQRMMVTDNLTPAGRIWKAADLSPIGFVSLPSAPQIGCSDGLSFWATLPDTNQLARF